MLPVALQMQPHQELPPPAFDDFSGTVPMREHDVLQHGPQSFGHVPAPYQRSFPIRITQPQLHTHPHEHQGTKPPATLQLPEYKLRRKTPSGTVDAAYDGSPMQPVPGPPPFKHMILPVTGTTRQQVTAPAGQYSSRHGWTAAHAPRGHEGDPIAPPWVINGLPPAQLAFSHGQVMDHMPAHLNLHHSPGQFGMDVQQPVLRANEYNVRAICPPPYPINGSFPFGHIAWQPGSSPSCYRGFDQSQAITLGHGAPELIPDGRPILYDLTGHSAPGCWAGPGNLHRGTEPMSYEAGSWHVNQTSFLTRPPLNAAPNASPGFKEKALSHAHQSYVDLLAFLQASGRANPLKMTSGPGTPHRLSVYPRPRKPAIGSAWNHRPSNRTATPRGFAPSDAYTGGSKSGGQRMPTPNIQTGADFRHENGLVSPNVDLVGGTHLFLPGHQSSVTYYPPLTRSSPAESARASAEVLESLCEQSGWKWLDGMLLGGCLHYGLERYEEALAWFSRIIATNPSHVEAITNTAATLYCLNRQDEAERHWLKAVELRPSYLEATEHLVGLLYKKRSTEAVEIISHVQRALKLVSNTDDNKTTSWALGYGSSGYALPGAENGRILALVHAKGTMLYSLKEVEKAAEAFEEAVLISAGRNLSGIQDLIRRVQSSLSPSGAERVAAPQVDGLLRPLMLPPEKARHTAQLVFSGGGELPGLAFMRNGPARRAAIQTTSNSLLSLAKIFQDAMSSGSAVPGILRRSSSVGDILALYYLSLSLQESPSTANNVGILLAGVQQVAVSSSRFSTGEHAVPGVSGINPGSGMALALAYYNYGLRLDPKHVHLHTNLGSLLKDIGQLDLAIQMYERAVSCDGTFDIALTNLANAVKDKGRINDAIAYYRRAVASNPSFAEAVCGLLTALNSVCNWRGRGGVVLAGGKYDRWHVNDDGKLLDANASGRGFGLTKRVVDIVKQQLRDSALWGRHALQEPVASTLAAELQHRCRDPSFELGEALKSWADHPWEGSRVVRLIERSTRVILRDWYLDRFDARREAKSTYPRPQLPPSLTVPAAPTVLPFHTFTCPLSAKDIRAISQRNAMRISCSTLRAPWLPSSVYPPPAPPDPHLNIGYISSDFNNHPLAHLMQSVFGFHNPTRARAFCYATTPSDNSIHRQQIEREAPVFRDVSAWPPEKLIEQIVRDGIHILVNLNGYTRGARNEIFAARPTPIQMSFMGFAGSLGAEWCDYILADTTAIPPSTLRPWRRNVDIEDVIQDESESSEDEWVYAENIIFCRDTFFCCDHAQSCDSSERDMSWEEEKQRRWVMRKQLFPDMADDVVILGNFNQLYKIEPTTFRSWLRILARVPKAVLWLLRFPEPGEGNLRATAKAWAGSEVASRLIFTDVAPKSQHIARARVCDLFLDTPECNAHTTAADVLWSSTPLLTLPRYPYKMCSRMAASILRGALPRTAEGQRAAADLIAEGESGYEQTAVALAGGLIYEGAGGSGYCTGRGRLAELRRLLWDSKWHCGLFNTRRWVDDVESAYEEAWRRWVNGVGGDIYL